MTSQDNSESLSVGCIDPDLYIADFAQMLRDVLRAIAATDSSSAVAKASGRLRQLIAHIDELPPSMNYYRILEAAVDQLKTLPRTSIDYTNEYDEVARKGLKYIAEATAPDGLSAARQGQARRDLIDSIKGVENVRELKRQGLM